MAAAIAPTIDHLESGLSFSPADISVYIGGFQIGTCLSVTYSITREVVGLFGLGDANALGFNKGKRGIAGSLVFNTFQNHPLLRSAWADSAHITGEDTLGGIHSTSFQTNVTDFGFQNGTFKLDTNPNFSGTSFNTNDADINQELLQTYNWVKKKAFNYADQVPPFDIVLTFVNEVGDAAMMTINGVILANEGGGFSVDDITTEVAFTYVARSITPLKAFVPAGGGTNRRLSGLLANAGGNIDVSNKG